MQARRLPAERGARWLLEGFRLFRRNPPLITALTLVYLLAVQTLTLLLPGIGPLLLPLLLPVLTLLVANGCRTVDLNQAPGRTTLLEGLRGNAPALLRLGLLQLAGAVLLVLANLALGDGLDPLLGLEQLQSTPNMAEGEGGAAAGPGEAAVLGALLRLLLLASPLIVAFWFAPFLVGWDRISPAKAVFFSTIAGFRNWRAMLMFGLAVIGVAGIVPSFILILVSQVAGIALSAAFIALRLLLVFLVAPVLTASVYISYRDIFQAGSADAHE